jgi:hypothetical protein
MHRPSGVRRLLLRCGMAALSLGCATTNLVAVQVALPGPLDRECLADTLAAQPGVRDFRELPQDGRPGYWFEIGVGRADARHTPGFVVVQRKLDGQWRIEVESSFEARGSDVRGAVVRRQRSILRRVVSVCAERGIEFGNEHVCGRGEKRSICQHGDAR